MADLSAIYREDATEEEFFDAYQAMIDSGQAWLFEGHVGRTAMDLIDSGICVLGPESRPSYYGDTIPGRDDVEEGTKGTIAYARERHPERWPAAG